MKKYVRKILQYAAAYMGLLLLYVLLLMAGQAIPRNMIVDNAMQSYRQLRNMGLYFEGVDGAEWDNWTDSYFINTAVTEYQGNLLQKAVANAYTTFKEVDDSGSVDVIDDIKYAIDQNSSAIVKPYSRYWVGMLLIYKILLIFMPVNGIRTFVFGVALILFALSVICVYKILGLKGLAAYLVSVVVAQYIPQSMCLVFNTDISIMFMMMVICGIMLKKELCQEFFYVAFFLAGSILAYLNYWAFPLITLGFPLVFVISARLINGEKVWRLTKETIFLSMSWGAGLVGTVLAKQILCKLVLGFQDGTGQLMLRMGSEFTLNARLVSAANGLVRRVESMPVLLLVIIVTVWLVMMFGSKGYNRRYRCFLFILIAFYPVIWWFLLPNHCIHGFVKHMYGVTYYSFLSAALINCDGFRPDFGRFKLKLIWANVGVLVVWVLISYEVWHADIHYSSKETEPWSLETIGTIEPGGGISQTVHFGDFLMDTAYLKNISTILVNLPEDKKDGTLHVELSENGSLIKEAEIQIADAPVGEWFQVPMGCIVELGHEYQVTYTVYGNELSEPYLLLQSQAQATGPNDMLYVDGQSIDGAIANKYAFDEYMLPARAKVCIIFILLLFMEYGLYLFEVGKSGDKV